LKWAKDLFLITTIFLEKACLEKLPTEKKLKNANMPMYTISGIKISAAIFTRGFRETSSTKMALPMEIPKNKPPAAMGNPKMTGVLAMCL